jgi:hypothetical protein
VHNRTIQINHQPDATIFQFIILTFVYSSTCFGCFPVHHQELNDCSGSLWFYLRIMVTPRYEGKTRGCHCSHWAPDDGRKNARNKLSCKQTFRIINWKTVAWGWWFIWIKYKTPVPKVKMHMQAYERKGKWQWWSIISKTGKSLHFWALLCGESRYKLHNKTVRGLRSTKVRNLIL